MVIRELLMENKILLDNIIFKLQTIGGISNYWYNLSKGLVDNNNIFYLEDNYLNKNYYRSLIKLSENLIQREIPTCKGGDESIFLFLPFVL